MSDNSHGTDVQTKGAQKPLHSAIVAGGGLAGISAALALARHGVQVTLLESKSRLGGRAGSFPVLNAQRQELESIDYCQHVGMGCCTNLKQLIGWLDQVHDWKTHEQLHFFGPDGRYQKLSALPLLPAPYHLAAWLARWPGLQLGDRISVARGMLSIRKVKLDMAASQQSALDWLLARGQTARAIDHFWKTIVVSALGEELGRVHLAALGKVMQDGFLNHRSAFHLLVPAMPLSELFGHRSQAKLQQAGVEIHVQSALETVATHDDSRVTVTTKRGSFNADGLVLALPWYQISKVEDVDRRLGLARIATQADQLSCSPISGVHTWWDRAWLSLPHAAIVGRLCQWVFPHQSAHNATNSVPNQQAQDYYCQIVISASRSLHDIDPVDVAKQIHEDLAQVFPEVGTAKLLRLKIVTDPRAVFSVSPESSSLRPDVNLSERVALAGDWTNTGWPATMEGAVLSGFRAAEHLLKNRSPLPKFVCKPLGG